MTSLYEQHLTDLLEEFALEDVRLEHAMSGNSSKRARIAYVRWAAAWRRLQKAVEDWVEQERAA